MNLHKMDFVVVSVVPVDEPVIMSTLPPAIKGVRITAWGGEAGRPMLIWQDSYLEAPKVGQKFTMVLQEGDL